MSDRPASYIAQEWSVHAQLTISHHRPDAEATPATPQDDGVRMEYSWSPLPGRPTSPRPCYGFQRGNIVFTTRPASGQYGSLPARRPSQPYGRRCKSTCSITLRPEPPLREVCEVCGGERSPSSLRRAANYTTHFCTRLPDKTPPPKQSHDAASQTHDADAAATSKPLQPRMGNKLYTKRKSVTDLLHIPPPDVPEAAAEERQTPADKARSPDSTGKSPGHKPRTVHIDVYCTGSDASDSSSSSSSSSSAGASWSSPQTVFESDEVRVVHTRAGPDRLPPSLRDARGYDSEDGLSSRYPSQLSSRYPSQLSSATSFNESSLSSSSCAATSWKDTTTDLSLAQSDSFEYADSIDRLRIKHGTATDLSLAQSDSFEYADSIDRLRIKQRERAWAAGVESKTWRSPQTERRHLKLLDKSDESEDDGDETGDAWSFGGGSSSRVGTLRREETVRKATPATLTTQPPPAPPPLLSSATSPFAGLVSRAERFGTMVAAFRKPGHHVGPSKNPECLCAHCRSFYLELDEGRGRTRSLDISLETAENWRAQLHKQVADKQLAKYEDHWDDSTAV